MHSKLGPLRKRRWLTPRLLAVAFKRF